MVVEQGKPFHINGYCTRCRHKALFGFFLYPSVNPHLRKKVVVCGSCGNRKQGKYMQFRKKKRKYKMR